MLNLYYRESHLPVFRNAVHCLEAYLKQKVKERLPEIEIQLKKKKQSREQVENFCYAELNTLRNNSANWWRLFSKNILQSLSSYNRDSSSSKAIEGFKQAVDTLTICSLSKRGFRKPSTLQGKN